MANSKQDYPQVLLENVVQTFDDLIGRIGEHAVVAGEEVYIQPPVYLSLHLVQMRAAGWSDVDFGQIAAVSGASALFGYQPGEFGPKYAHLYIGPEKRIADATGFGYEWVPFEGAEGAWSSIVENVDAGRSLKGWDWENILFAGYQDADEAADRKVYALADGPDTYARWLTWSEFCEWVALVEGWHCPQLGRHTERVPPVPAREVALRVLEDLVAWSTDPPDIVRERHPEAAFGLAGIEMYAATCENVREYEDLTACHDVNGQWAMRNSTGVYLRRVAEGGVFPTEIRANLIAAAEAYRAAYESWQELYALIGHGATEAERKDIARRAAAAAAVRKGLAHEKVALAELAIVLGLLKDFRGVNQDDIANPCRERHATR